MKVKIKIPFWAVALISLIVFIAISNLIDKINL